MKTITFPCADIDAVGKACTEVVYYSGTLVTTLVSFSPLLLIDKKTGEFDVVTLKCCKDHVHNYPISNAH
jgi:hypothetical protein